MIFFIQMEDVMKELHKSVRFENSTLISENQIRLQFALHPSSSQSEIAIGIWYAPLGTCINTVGDTISM